MSKMTVIQLLNKIANGEEVPKKIAIKNRVLIYNEDEILNLQDYYYMNDDEDATWEIWDYKLNDKVEVIEDNKEDNDIEPLIYESDDYDTNINGYLDSEEQKELIVNKINEIIEVVNKIKNNSENK